MGDSHHPGLSSHWSSQVALGCDWLRGAAGGGGWWALSRAELDPVSQLCRYYGETTPPATPRLREREGEGEKEPGADIGSEELSVSPALREGDNQADGESEVWQWQWQWMLVVVVVLVVTVKPAVAPANPADDISITI